jgi:hypothetical protein
MTWRFIIAAGLAGYGIAAYAAWEIVRQVSVIAAVWAP